MVVWQRQPPLKSLAASRCHRAYLALANGTRGATEQRPHKHHRCAEWPLSSRLQGSAPQQQSQRQVFDALVMDAIDFGVVCLGK